MKMPRSQLLLIVLLLAPLASAITLQTDLIEGSFKIKVKKKSENHSEFGMHVKSFADAHCSEITMSKYLKVAPGGLFSGLVQGLLLFGSLKKDINKANS